MASFAILPQILPDELLFTILKFASNTRVDWRTCKKREALLIQGLGGVEQDQTLFGRLYMAETLKLYPELGVPGAAREPESMEDYRVWYMQQYRWLHRVENRWV